MITDEIIHWFDKRWTICSDKQSNFLVYPTKICLVVYSLNSSKPTRFLLTQSKPSYVVKSDQYRIFGNALKPEWSEWISVTQLCPD